MRLKSALLSATVAALLLTTPTLAAQESAPEGKGAHEGACEGRKVDKLARMERRMSRAVERGHLSQAQADQFIAEARQLRDELQAQRQANGGRLTDEQKQQFKQRRQALREKVKAAKQASAPQSI